LSRTLVIVGGGVIGLCAAYYASKDGWKVTVVDRDAEDHHGCSWGNAGMVVPSHFIPLAAPGMVGMGIKMLFNPEGPFAIRPSLKPSLVKWGWLFMKAAKQENVDRSAPALRDLSMLSRGLYEEMAEASGNAFELEKRGLLMLCQHEKTLHEEAEVAEAAQKLGLRARVLNTREVAATDPGIAMDVAGAIHFEDDCHLSPGLLLAWLREHLRAQGVELLYRQEAIGWTREDDQIVALQTTKGNIEADEFVLAAGAWSPDVAHDLRLSIPMQAGKGYSVTMPEPPQLPTLCSILTEARVAVTPMGASLRIGGTMELTGNDLSINRRRLQGIFRSVPKYFPKFNVSDFEGLEVWRGLRPCSPDGLPYIGRLNKTKNIVVATAHAMMGVSLAPATGKLVAEMLAGEKTSVATNAFNPNRFDLNDLKAVS